ncbi:C1 family peptidase [Lactococcus hodotermopsidis]|nr:C1 family peptidase [Lactococcus hodotermopsidis]
MSLYNGGGMIKGYSSNDDDNNRRNRQRKKKIIIASAAGGGTLLAGIIIAVIVAGTLALGTLGLIADSPVVIEDARRIVEPDNNEHYNAYDNSDAYPAPGNQGSQGSCTAWATAYALKSAQEKTDLGWDFTVNPALSPAYVYNQINYGQDGGALISEAMRLVTQQGVCALNDMPYNEKDHRTKPNSTQISKAAPHNSKEWFSISGVDQIKNAIVKYGGVVVGVNVYPDMDKLDEKNPVYDVQSGKNRGGHAICLVGFDDAKNAFKFINSWGTDWGLEGFGWITYDIVENDTQLYGAFSMTDN